MLKLYLFVIFIKIIFSDNQIPIGVKNKTIELKQSCQELKINTNYKHIKINIQNVKNIDKLIITDKPLTNDCNINECHANSTLCQSIKYIYYSPFDE